MGVSRRAQHCDCGGGEAEDAGGFGAVDEVAGVGCDGGAVVGLFTCAGLAGDVESCVEAVADEGVCGGFLEEWGPGVRVDWRWEERVPSSFSCVDGHVADGVSEDAELLCDVGVVDEVAWGHVLLRGVEER